MIPTLQSPGITRRESLRWMGTAMLSALAADSPLVSTASAEEKAFQSSATADSMILLWMSGGMAHTETFDPKHYVPFSPGIDSRKVLSTFPAIDSAVDHIKLSQGLEEIASVMDLGSIIRTYSIPIVDKITHSRYQYLWHTGYMPPLPVAAPHLGAVIARTLGPRRPDMPAFININEPLLDAKREAAGIQSFLTAGFLGAEYGPFSVPFPAKAAEQMRSQVGEGRLSDRVKLWRSLVNATPLDALASDYQRESLMRSFDQAYRLMNSPVSQSFDLSREDSSVYDYYNTGSFGLGCLLARRLVESGARFIEVHTPYEPFGRWDTHAHGHEVTARMKQEIDRPVAQLIRDLHERGLLERTLVVLASEFSRDVLIEGKVNKRARVGQAAIVPTMQTLEHYGMHAHFADAGSVVLFGGGIRKGYVYGRTADEHPCTTIEKPVSIENLHATIYRAMGIAPDLAYDIERRPFYVTKDGKGEPIDDLFS